MTVGIAAALGMSAAWATGQYYTAATIGYVMTPSETQNCLFITLVGVSQADPIAPGNPWIAIPSTQNGFSQVYATILEAKAIGASVDVATTGVLAGGSCGSDVGLHMVMLR